MPETRECKAYPEVVRRIRIVGEGSRAWRAGAALSGAVSVVLIFVGSAVIARTSGAGRHSVPESGDAVAEYVSDADHARVLVGEYVGALGVVLFLLFAIYLLGRVARPGATDSWLRRSGDAAAATYVALTLAAVAALVPALNREGDAAAGFLDLRTALIALAFVALAAWLLVVGLHVLETRSLPRWLGWAAVALALLQFVMTPLARIDPGFTGLPTFATFLWIVIASVLLFRRERSPQFDARAG